MIARPDGQDGPRGEGPGRTPSMHDHGESDSPVVPAKSPNKPGSPGAEAVEERGLAKGNTASKTRPGRSAGTDAPSALERVRQAATLDKEARFTALLHHVDVDRLRAAYRALSPRAAAVVDGVTWQSYGQQLEEHLHDLHGRLQRGSRGTAPAAAADRADAEMTDDAVCSARSGAFSAEGFRLRRSYGFGRVPAGTLLGRRRP